MDRSEHKALVIAAVREGSPLSTAALRIGVARQTIYAWAKADERFAAALRQAEGERQYLLVRELQLNADWKSKAWLLERTSPDFREQKELVVQNAVETTLEQIAEHMSIEAQQEMWRALAVVKGLDLEQAAAPKVVLLPAQADSTLDMDLLSQLRDGVQDGEDDTR